MSAEPDLNTATFDGFLLALRVMYRLYDIDEPAVEFQKPWSLVKEIAEGETTLSNPGDLAARFPGMADFVYEQANLVVQDDRGTARRVLRGMQTSLNHDVSGEEE